MHAPWDEPERAYMEGVHIWRVNILLVARDIYGFIQNAEHRTTKMLSRIFVYFTNDYKILYPSLILYYLLIPNGGMIKTVKQAISI